MTRSGAHFSSQELARVLSHYDIGIIERVAPLIAGNVRAPKLVITTDKGVFLLKRRPHGKDDPLRVAFAHQVQRHLAAARFPLAPLITTRDEESTMLCLDKHLYELFHYIAGHRYNGSPRQTHDAGLELARFHAALHGAQFSYVPGQQTFHDAKHVRRHLHHLAHTKSSPEYQILLDRIETLYHIASRAVNTAGFRDWPSQIIHGDWHPGNMLFSDNRIVAVLDFDSAKYAPPAIDVANGALQFSIVSGRPNPADWPAYLDQAKLSQFLAGYRTTGSLPSGPLSVIIDLMIETLIAEAVEPVAATGFFGNLSGFEFLRMIHRKCCWLDENRNILLDAISI
jgi:Ser/Thr protein kinase RdoA (MazF antagonist)